LAAGTNAVRTFSIPHFFLQATEWLILGLAETKTGLRVSCALARYDARASDLPFTGVAVPGQLVIAPTLTKGTSGRKKYQKKIPDHGEYPLQTRREAKSAVVLNLVGCLRFCFDRLCRNDETIDPGLDTNSCSMAVCKFWPANPTGDVRSLDAEPRVQP
jgi:hypothetical protein